LVLQGHKVTRADQAHKDPQGLLVIQDRLDLQDSLDLKDNQDLMELQEIKDQLEQPDPAERLDLKVALVHKEIQVQQVT
jgi:hypothetical protein